MRQSFYSRLSYSIGNEDWKTEQLALKIKPKDRIVAVTASGDRPLNLLVNPCEELIAIDANPFQTALSELKKTALLNLDYEEYIRFIGAKPCSYRKETLQKLYPYLNPTLAQFWEAHKEKIVKGVIYEGSLERLLKMASTFLHLILGKKIHHLFELSNLEEQRSFIEERWNHKLWKKAFKLFLSPTLTRFFLKDPGLYAFVDPNIQMPYYLHDRILGSLKKFPVKENIFVSLACYGKVFEEGFSPYLTFDGVEQIKKQCHKISMRTEDIITFLENSEENSFDCFSLSDVASYMKKEDFHRLCFAVYKTARNGARFCLRQFLSSYSIPEELTPYLQRDEELEALLEEEDRCSFYRFIAGRIIK